MAQDSSRQAQHSAARLERLNRLRIGASVCLVGLIAVCLAWELWLAPIRPGGSLLALKALPLAAALYGIVRGARYTYQWSSMLVLAYFVEGVMRGWSEHGLSQQLALAEVALSVIFFACAVAYARLSRPPARGQF
ncbi:MAG: DUF2069 domain-containing protein [Betaproteobacteria bacterium]|nr:DUF2069 domain-containing protein [Betaproteobacteria bacterium]